MHKCSSIDEIVSLLDLQIYPNKEINSIPKLGIESIKFITHNGSYNRISKDMKNVFLVGTGPKSKPGHPNGHQKQGSQTLFFKDFIIGKPIQMIHETSNNELVYLGKYKIQSIVNKISNEGFVFCEINLGLLKPTNL